MRRQKELIIVGFLELVAVVLARWQALGGVRTDEAKYLLNIPYPHPPLMRWLMSMTEFLSFQEMFWRILLATLMIQAVWLVWDMTRLRPRATDGQARTLHQQDRIMISAGWLFSTAVLVQAGSVVLALIVAMEALVFIWLRTRPELCKKIPYGIGLFWLATVFTAFQSVLFFPLVWHILRRAHRSRTESFFLTFAPFALLTLWSLSNPLAIATMVIHADGGASGSVIERLMVVGKLWIIGGAGVISVVGTYGILRSRDWYLIASFILVCAYVTASVPYPFYAILFTPLLIGGLVHLFAGRRHPGAFPLLACMISASAILTWFSRPPERMGPAREVMAAISGLGSGWDVGSGSVLIAGSFGHDWQYESRSEVRRYKPELVKTASAIVCLSACEPMFDTNGWKQLKDVRSETWVRR